MAGNIATKKLAKADNDLFSLLGLDDDDVSPDEWEGVPAFVQRKKNAEYTVNINFRTLEDLEKFAEVTGMLHLKIPGKRNKACWYPPLKDGERGQNCLAQWFDENDPEIAHLIEAENKI